MKNLDIGMHVFAQDVPTLIDRIIEAEDVGIQTAWMTSGGPAPDPLAVFSAVARETKEVNFGTSIVPTFPRHPIALAQGASVVDQLAPGRLKLGIGPSHKPAMEMTYRFEFVRPLQHLREYLIILNALLKDGKVSFHGDRLHAEAELPGGPTGIKVMASALRANAFRLCGEIADGGISWVAPLHYLKSVALPALVDGAKTASREKPALIAHVPVVVCEDPEEVWNAASGQFGFYPRLPIYSSMWQDAGFPEAADGEFSRAMCEALVVQGNENEVAEKIESLPSYGVDEMLASVVILNDHGKTAQATIELLGSLSKL